MRRGGARGGDLCVVCGTIGDGWLGLKAARGEIEDPGGVLAKRYRLPEPLIALAPALRRHARAAADVSDGLLADALHIAEASGLGVEIDLATLPLSPEAVAWLGRQPEEDSARAALATGGDDYAIVCAVPPEALAAFLGEVAHLNIQASAVGAFSACANLRVRSGERPVVTPALGWRH